MRVLEDWLKEVLKVDPDLVLWGGTPGNFKFNPFSDDDGTRGLQTKLSETPVWPLQPGREEKHRQGNPGHSRPHTCAFPKTKKAVVVVRSEPVVFCCCCLFRFAILFNFMII